MSTKTAPIAYKTSTASEATGLSQSHLVEAIRRGALKARKSSVNDDGEPTGHFIIKAVDLAAYIDSLPEA